MVLSSSFFFFNDTATTEIYTLSLHDALPIWIPASASKDYGTPLRHLQAVRRGVLQDRPAPLQDRKSTRLNSSHSQISYAVFCLKKKTPPRRSVRSSGLCSPVRPEGRTDVATT